MRVCMLFFFAMSAVTSQAKSTDYVAKEGIVLPDPLVCADGTRIQNRADWESKRRPELLTLIEEQMYGQPPPAPGKSWVKLVESSDGVLEGKARRRQWDVSLSGTETGPFVRVLAYLPADSKGPVPAFVGLNFNGNHTVNADPAILMGSNGWTAGKKPSHEVERGKAQSRWPVEQILGAGFAMVTAYCGDIDPDQPNFADGVHALHYREGQTHPEPGEWGSVAAWVWGLSRIVDGLETLPEIDAGKLAVVGHSRLGKTALWAGAKDPRFRVVVSNDSGCGGAALSMRHYGETVQVINKNFPHWFCGNFKKYDENESSLPFDQHEVIALCAPRAVYVASATEDQWADPLGEFLALKAAYPVFALYGLKDVPLEAEGMQADQSFQADLGYHLRTGKHDITAFDWEQYLRFARRHLGMN